jgi:excisionase family DNA binding protein
MSEKQIFFSARELAERFGIAQTTVWQWAREGRIPPAISLFGRNKRWNLSEVEAAMRAWVPENKSAKK